jgi:hypothetical protein
VEYYNASHAPDSKEWLELDESLRIELVRNSIGEDIEDDVPEDARFLHATIHVVVENQLAMGVDPVPVTMEKLIRRGLTRHEALHAIGAVLAEDIFDLLQSNEKSWPKHRYRRRLEKLTAKRWRKGQW